MWVGSGCLGGGSRVRSAGLECKDRVKSLYSAVEGTQFCGGLRAPRVRTHGCSI